MKKLLIFLLLPLFLQAGGFGKKAQWDNITGAIAQRDTTLEVWVGFNHSVLDQGAYPFQVYGASYLNGAGTFTGNLTVGGFINLGTPTGLTLVTGAVTATKGMHTLDTEADAVLDTCITISGGAETYELTLKLANSDHNILLEDGTGNLELNGDFLLDQMADRIRLQWDATLTKWVELFRSSNATD